VTLPAISELIPHRPPMLLLDRVLHFEADRVVCSARPTEGSIFARQRAIPAVIMLEYMAQATAVCLALARPEPGSPAAFGLLVAARRLTLKSAELAFDTELTVVAALTATLGEGASFDCHVDAAGTNLASAQLTVFVPSERV
jgi:predicted hotdog family 3-hydroxylacyl-ACP dehydratase